MGVEKKSGRREEASEPNAGAAGVGEESEPKKQKVEESDTQNGDGSKQADDDDVEYTDVEEEQPQGAATQKQPAPGSEQLPQSVLEEGKIVFFYRPKVATEHPTNIDEVQRFHILLEPQALNKAAVSEAEESAKAGEAPAVPDKTRCRLITIGKKRLPDVKHHERYYGFVSAVGDSAQELTKDMGESSHETKTRGTRVQPAARVAGSGAYTLCMKPKGSRKEVQLAYKLELPTELGPCQEELNIGNEGELIVSIKNPDMKEQGRTQGLPAAGPPPDYSEAQKQLWQGRRWIGLVDPSLMDHAGAELLFIGGRTGIQEGGVDQAAAKELIDLTEEHKQEAGGGGKAEALKKTLEKEVGSQPVVAEPTTKGDWA